MLPFFEALEKTRVATAIQGTTWFMPLANTIHALGMTLLLGSIIVLSLRLIGVVMATRPVSLIAREIWPWTIIGLRIMLTTGLILFLPESVRWFGSVPFRVKMSFCAGSPSDGEAGRSLFWNSCASIAGTGCRAISDER